MITRLLDRGLSRLLAPFQRASLRNTETGVLAQRLQDLTTEAARLEGVPFAVENPVIRATTADLDDVLRQNAALIAAIAPEVAALGITAAGQLQRQLAYPNLSDAQLASIGVAWNRPDPRAIESLVNYVDSAAFRTSLNQYRTGIQDAVRNIVIRGVANGQNPITTARELRQIITGLPTHRANSMLRTLQMVSYRDGAVIHQVANSDLIEYVIRVATLDNRTCMACVVEHGTRLAVGERVNDHWQGRCVGIPIVRGRTLNIQSGVDWFEAQPEERQRAQMGNAAYDAWRDGAIKLQDFPHRTTDLVFGEMIVENSLKGMLGDGARRYYSR